MADKDFNLINLIKSGNLVGECLNSSDPSLSCTGLKTIYHPPLNKGRLSLTVFYSLSILTSVRCIYE